MATKRVTLREVAELAGVNPSTVSRALSPFSRHLVNPETLRRVQAAALELDYAPNRVASSLRTGRSHSIGVVIPDLTNPLFPPVVRGISDGLASAGYTALVTNTDRNVENERTMLETLLERQVDGLIMASAATDDELVAIGLDRGVPVVLVNRMVDDHRILAVLSDDWHGMNEAVGHLASLGHRSIGHVAGPLGIATGVLRRQAFFDAMATHGLDVPDRAVVVASTFTESGGTAAARELLRSFLACTAIVAANDLIALGCYAAAAELGRSCPDDLSVVGFNDMPFADKFCPPLTTVRIPAYEMGVRAARLLIDRLQDGSVPVGPVLLPTRIVVRGSVARAEAPLPAYRHRSAAT
jgi:LacI family transcriptional regulator